MDQVHWWAHRVLKYLGHEVGLVRPDPLPKASRQRRNLFGCFACKEVLFIADFISSADSFRAIPRKAQIKLKIFNYRHVWPDRAVLWQVANPLLGLKGLIDHRQSINIDFPTRGFKEAGEHFHNRCFARAIVSKQANDFTRFNLKVYIAYCDGIAITSV